MPLQAGDGLREIIVQAVDAVILRRGPAHELSLTGNERTQALADVRIVADLLGDNVAGALQGVLNGLNAFFGVEKILSGDLGPRAIALLREEQRGERRKALLLRHRGAGAALLLVRTVEVFDLGKRFGAVDGGGKLVCQLALLVDGLFHRFAALFKTAEVLEPLFERAQRGIVHCTVELLAVAGDKGDGVALVEQMHDVFNVPGVFAERGSKGLNEIHKMFLSYIGRRSGAVK